MTPHRTWTAIALGGWLVLAIAACTEQVPLRPVGQFSWEPQPAWMWPVEGSIVRAYGDVARTNHQGIDLAARPGDPVAAALGGTVAYAGEVRGYGKVVALSHGESLATVYGHLGDVRVHEGERVAAGQVIGALGPDGYLHYEIRQADRTVDPAKYYAVAPRPVAGGAVDVSVRLGEEPPGVGPIPPIVVAAAGPPAPPPPTPETRVVKRRSTPLPEATASRPPQPTPTSRPPATPTPAEIRAPAATQPTPSEIEEQAVGSDTWSGIGLGAAVVGCNLLYMPLKLGYAAVGAVVGGATLVLTGNSAVANDVWRPAFGGDYLVTAEHLRGEEPLHFAGAREETPAPSPPPRPSRHPPGS